MFLSSQLADGRFFPNSADLQRGILDEGSLSLMRSSILKSAIQKAMMGHRRSGGTVVTDNENQATLWDAVSLAVMGVRIKVLEAVPFGPVGREVIHDEYDEPSVHSMPAAR